MKKKIRKHINNGLAPIHLLSLVNRVGGDVHITKNRSSQRYNTNHLQIGILYKSPL